MMKIARLSNKKVAIIAGSGDLPGEVIKSLKKLHIDFSVIKFSGVTSSVFNEEKVIEASFENISNLFIQLKKFSFNAVVCCGYMQKPELDLNKITEDSLNILAPIIKNFNFGDEAVFLSILEMFRDRELTPVSPIEIIPKAFPKYEYLTEQRPSDVDISDCMRSEEILKIISPADLGQSVIVSNGSCLAVETALGTDQMLNWISSSKKYNNKLVNGGVLYKAPKLNQNLFIDIPVIGKKTISAVKRAGLNGIAIKHSSVIVLDNMATIDLANQLGVFIWSKK